MERPPGILVVEDEAIVALDLQCILEDMGVSVIGPCPSVASGMSAVEWRKPDAAILDVQLADGEVYALADALHAAQVPLIFHSGHADSAQLSKRYPGARFCPKPSSAHDIESCVAALMA
ncbi:response regulator [Acidimangrovimonas sediminis]|uniref:response regulator n=1 Tax=Acidimangrovimonas sediminis TaxID=2056283 RepID=UPI001E2EBE97|nr:response regulator [Acidimangrovimonas sediminis]